MEIWLGEATKEESNEGNYYKGWDVFQVQVKNLAQETFSGIYKIDSGLDS